MKRPLISAFAALFLFPAAISAFAAPAQDLGYCTTCHGAQGNGNNAIRAPKLAGMAAWYVANQLAAFRAGWRGSEDGDLAGREMQRVALALPNEAAVAQAALQPRTFVVRHVATTVQGDADRGARLYAACATCHGAAGEGSATLQAPSLHGQSDWYLVTQLQHFRDGMRGAHPDDARGAQMRALVATLPDDRAINDVVAYISSL